MPLVFLKLSITFCHELNNMGYKTLVGVIQLINMASIVYLRQNYADQSVKESLAVGSFNILS